MLLVHRRDVIKPIEIADRLRIGFVLDQLFSATMEQSLGPNDHHVGPSSLPPYPNSEMVDDDEIQSEDEIHSHLTNGGPSHSQMDEAFCARMLAAIEAGLESAPIGVVTTPGTKNPKYVPTKHPRPLVSPLVDMDV
jgi:hypothetical protein